jgi:hypothetical protein
LEYLNRGFIIGPPPKSEKFRKRAILDSRIALTDKFCPSEFDRRVESSDYLGTWKASTYRQFFLYLAYPLLEDLLDDDWQELLRYFQYFVYLIGGADPNPVPEYDLQFAQQIIEFWVTKYLHLTNGRGKEPSIHYALHMVNDCRVHGCHYDVLSAFKYENCLRYVKDDIQSGNYKLEQLKNRMMERNKYEFNRDASGQIIWLPSGKVSMGLQDQIADDFQEPDTEVVFTDTTRTKRLKLPQCDISNSFRDSFVLFHESGSSRRSPNIMRVERFCRQRTDGKLVVVGHVYQSKTNLFSAPADSMLKHVYCFSEPQGRDHTIFVTEIVGKLYVVPRFKEFGIRLADEKVLGKVVDEFSRKNDFSKVTFWVGVVLRHVLGKDASLY